MSEKRPWKKLAGCWVAPPSLLVVVVCLWWCQSINQIVLIQSQMVAAASTPKRRARPIRQTLTQAIYKRDRPPTLQQVDSPRGNTGIAG